MARTKLTRKEIVGDDPVKDALISAVALIRDQTRFLVAALLIVILIGVGIYLAIQYFQEQGLASQESLSRGLAFFHASISDDAPDDPYGKGPQPVFRTSEAKYEAAQKEFDSLIADGGSSESATIARYYLGLIQQQQGKSEEARQSFESVSQNTRNRTIAHLGQKLLAKYHREEGSYDRARVLLESMLEESDLPKHDLQLELSRALAGQGERERAIEVLTEAKASAGGRALETLFSDELNRLQFEAGGTGEDSGQESPSN